MAGDLRRLFAAGAVVAAVMAVSAGARADFRDGNQLYANCTSLNAGDQVFCLGYIAAISDAAQGPPDRPRAGVGGFAHCPGGKVTNQQMMDVVVQFLRTHTEHRDYGAAGLVAHALYEAFPCK